MFTIAIVAGAPRRSPTGLCVPLRVVITHDTFTITIVVSTFPVHRCDTARAQRNKSENTHTRLPYKPCSVSISPDHTYQGAKACRSGLDFSVGGEVGESEGDSPEGEAPPVGRPSALSLLRL